MNYIDDEKCKFINMVKINPAIIDNKPYIRFYSCCKNHLDGIPFEISYIEDKIKTGNFENFINSLTKQISCANGFGTCSQNYNVSKFDGAQVSLGLGCNINCSFCFAKNLRNELIENNLIKKYNELYFMILNEIAKSNFTKLRLTDHGEPLSIPGTLEFLESIPQDSKLNFINITTNGAFINDKLINTIKRHPKIKFEIQVSLNAFDKKSYKEIMGADKFDLVLENINKLKEAANSISNLKFKAVTFVLTEDLLADYENLFKFIDNEIKMPVYIDIDFAIRSSYEIYKSELLDKYVENHNKDYDYY